MADRPIIFSAPMVRALLDGTKTQTRRVLKPDPDTLPNGFAGSRLPYAIGDRLYVREAHAFDGPLVRYYATDDVHELRRKRPSIHMPRWASRLTLTVTDVRVQRLQEISGEDAVAEGWPGPMTDIGYPISTPLQWFAALWNGLHGPDAYDANPWVCALTFTVQRGNIDQLANAEPEGTR